jgi:NET1-associated nuclear protein 1 (U3 small nucleolar RNA-associated protein 17)
LEGRKRLVINQFEKKTPIKTFKKNKNELTCLSIHPNEDCIATGTTSGKIIIWYNYLSNDAFSTNEDGSQGHLSIKLKPTNSILHWHSLPVLSLTFTNEGSFLLSGGHECVLVKWMFKTGQKDFKPRLGSPISHISCSNDNTLYVLKHSDNCNLKLFLFFKIR